MAALINAPPFSSQCRMVSVADLYAGGEGGAVWTGVGYCSQVDDVAVQDLLISDGQWTETKCPKAYSAAPATTANRCRYINQYLLNTLHRPTFLHVFSDASD